MNKHADKTPQNKSQSGSVTSSPKQSGVETSLKFVDNRPESIAQRERQEMVTNSPQIRKAQAFPIMDKKFSVEKHKPIQRKMVFGRGTKDLDASKEKNGISDSAYLKVQNMAKEIEPTIILALDAQSTSNQAKFHPYGHGGLINVKPLPEESDKDYEYDQSARLIAVTHETQHALDHLHPESILKGELSKLTGEKGVRTELNAFAAQSAETEQLITRHKPVERKLIDMANAYINSTPESPTKMLFDIMKYYAWNYSNKFKEKNPDFEKVKNSPTLINATKKYISNYLSESRIKYESLIN